jgi:hypothetical protein
MKGPPTHVLCLSFPTDSQRGERNAGCVPALFSFQNNKSIRCFTPYIFFVRPSDYTQNCSRRTNVVSFRVGFWDILNINISRFWAIFSLPLTTYSHFFIVKDMSQWDMFCVSPSPSGHSKQICRPSIHVSELFSLCVSTKQARAHLMFMRSFLSEISKRPLSTSYVYAVWSSSYIKTCSRVFVCTCAF